MSVTITLGFTVQNDSVVQDIHNNWITQSAQVGMLSAAVTSGSTTLSLTLSGGFPGTSVAAIPVGSVVAIEGEAMSVTAATPPSSNATTLTVTRGSAVSVLAIPAAHASGTAVSLLRYASAAQMIASVAILPYVRKLSVDQGDNSAVFAYTVTQQVVINS